MINYKEAVEQAKANFQDLIERGNDAIGEDWEDVRKELFTAEEISESDSRVAVISELMGAKKMVYEWKYPLAVPAQKAGEYLSALEKEKGELTPELILNESRDENAVLHPCFEWDDEKAAESYRLWQARYLLRNITVKIEQDQQPPKIIRAYVNVTDQRKNEKGAFVSLNVAMNNSDYKAQVLKNALYELQTFKNKYAAYVELEKVFTAIDELAEKMLAESRRRE